MILKRLEVGPFASNCYIVGDETSKEGIIVDAGDEASNINRQVKNLGLKIKYIVITHAHTDHVGALKEVKEYTKAEVAIHVEDAKILSTRGSTSYGLKFPTPPEADKKLKGGDSIEVGKLKFLVLHTPGHTPGGICLFGEGVVFTGDTLFNQSIGRTDMPGGSYSTLMDGIHTKLMVLPDQTIVYPGHGPESTIGDERKWNPFLRSQGGF